MKQQVVYDIKAGICRRWYYFVGFAVLIVIMCSMQVKQISAWRNIISSEQVSYGNFLLVWFRGFSEVRRAKGEGHLVIPFEWIVLQITYFGVVLGYTEKNMKENGYLLFLRIAKKNIWWDSKCIWVALSTLIYYGIFFSITGIFASIVGSFTMNPISSIWVGELSYERNVECFLLTFILPGLVSFSMGMLAMLLEISVSGVISLIICLGTEIASAFWNMPFLPGNYSMFYRNQYFIGTGHVTWISGLIFCVVLTASVYFVGRYYINRFEFLGDK